MRINKFLAQALPEVSRREADQLVAKGLITLNFKKAVLSDSVNPLNDNVFYKGEKLEIKNESIYLLFNKPRGCITAVKNRHGDIKGTVMEFIPEGLGVFPVGRLDKDTTGVLIFTNDGDLTYALTHPSFGIEREYIAEFNENISQKVAESVEKGVHFKGEFYKAEKCIIEKNKKDNSFFAARVVLKEGKNREVRNMFKALGHRVVNLHRERFACLNVHDLRLGHYRKLSEKEIGHLKKMVHI
ncbi:MAG: pseudouridine synthase [bacterium]